MWTPLTPSDYYGGSVTVPDIQAQAIAVSSVRFRSSPVRTMQIGLFCCRMRLPSFPADCGRLIWMCTHLAIYLHHLPISHGAYSHLFAVADDNAPLTIVQAVWLSSSCRTFHLGTQSQRDDWLTYAFSGVLCSPWDFSCG